MPKQRDAKGRFTKDATLVSQSNVIAVSQSPEPFASRRSEPIIPCHSEEQSDQESQAEQPQLAQRKLHEGKTKQSDIPTLEELNEQAQRISPGFYPDRTVETDLSLSPEERIRAAQKLAMLYQKIGEPVPPAIGCLL